ncbi:hypothetical protein RYH80_18375 [Halobaculum sp. MBLA0147]|uniref:hypothetical protein n=1 Tax=Halobaculum sp. MBLA0147 TaxID=3079934 RepID=UPI003523A864
MTTEHIATAGNTPEVSNPDELETALDEFTLLVGPHASDTNIQVKRGKLHVAGNGYLRPVHHPTTEAEHRDPYADPDWKEFTEKVTPHINTPLKIRTVAHTKFRWKPGAEVLTLSPDGTLTRLKLGETEEQVLVE